MVDEIEPKPPIFAKWRNWYWFVMLVLAAQILVYLFITNLFQ